MTMIDTIEHVDVSAPRPVCEAVFRIGTISADGFRVLRRGRGEPADQKTRLSNRTACERLEDKIEAVRKQLTALRRDGECDDGRAHIGSAAALRLRLELIGLMVEHGVLCEGVSHMMPRALVLAREIADYQPSAQTVTTICYCYGLDPAWLLMGEGEGPQDLTARL